MNIPTFIENFETEQYEFCDKVIDRLEELLSQRDNPETAGHFMDGRVTNGDARNRTDFSFDFYVYRYIWWFWNARLYVTTYESSKNSPKRRFSYLAL